MIKLPPRNYRYLACLAWLATRVLLPAGNAFPPSPSKPWAPNQLGDYEQALRQDIRPYQNQAQTAGLDTNKIYDLAELIDLAERSHPQTRAAWERARQAAQNVGLSESSYYPYLAASASSGFQHELAVIDSVFPANGIEEDAALDVKWLLFDFGGRRATVAAARKN